MYRNANVLIVDDEERILRLLSIMFRDQYNVFTASSSMAALELVKTHQMHVIITDQRMPGMAGIDLLAEVRRVSPATVRLLLTGYADLVAIIGAVNKGEVYRFLNKPWDQDELKKAVADAVAVSFAAYAAANLPDAEDQPPAKAAKLLVLDGLRSTRHEIMEMFADSFWVLGASTIAEAREILMMHEVGVIITDTTVGGEDTSELLNSLNIHYPCLTTVLLTTMADCNTIIDLINKSVIYRFAMKPLAPKIFRLAVMAAMKEHHRRLADPLLAKGVGYDYGSGGSNDNLADVIARSLGGADLS